MTMTTRVLSVTVPVPDQDAAIAFYRDVLGCEVVLDAEIWPGARLVQVLPPGSDVPLLLLPPDSEIPVAVRLGTSSAQDAHDRLADSDAALHNDRVLHLDGAPPMFAFADPWGNQLAYLED
jgi:catechol 2,3-dioxygenase-like lactoylglutathione lyase family enzyme